MGPLDGVASRPHPIPTTASTSAAPPSNILGALVSFRSTCTPAYGTQRVVDARRGR